MKSSPRMSPDTRIERDSMGELQVPIDALWGAQTQRAVENFPISGQPMPRGFIRALGLVKAAAAEVNASLGLLPKGVAKAIHAASLQVASGEHDAHFPIDIYQTGSGTSSNMNANEVIAKLASAAGKARVHANDHVNLGQSSNDVIPTAIRVSAQLAVLEHLLPAIKYLRQTIDKRGRALARVVKTGRTHLMDAMPLTFQQEFSAWSAQLASAEGRLQDSLKRMRRLPLGGTAIGTGINADPRFGGKVDEFRAAGGSGRDRTAHLAAWQFHHARQGESGDSRSHGHGVRTGHRPPCSDYGGRADRQLPVERHLAVDRSQPAGFDPPIGQRVAIAGRFDHCRAHGAPGAYP